MHFHVTKHDILIRISIAIAAEMPAGIVSTYVSCEIAGAFFPVVRIAWHLMVLPYHPHSRRCPG